MSIYHAAVSNKENTTFTDKKIIRQVYYYHLFSSDVISASEHHTKGALPY